MKKPCGCYVDSSGNVFAACASCNGNAIRSAMEMKLRLSVSREADNAKRRSLRRDGRVRNHRQSEGGP